MGRIRGVSCLRRQVIALALFSLFFFTFQLCIELLSLRNTTDVTGY